MSAKPNAVEVIEHRKQWNDLFWLIAETDVTKFKETKKLETAEFFIFLEKWKEMIKNKLKNLRKNQN